MTLKPLSTVNPLYRVTLDDDAALDSASPQDFDSAAGSGGRGEGRGGGEGGRGRGGGRVTRRKREEAARRREWALLAALGQEAGQVRDQRRRQLLVTLADQRDRQARAASDGDANGGGGGGNGDGSGGGGGGGGGSMGGPSFGKAGRFSKPPPARYSSVFVEY